LHGANSAEAVLARIVADQELEAVRKSVEDMVSQLGNDGLTEKRRVDLNAAILVALEAEVGVLVRYSSLFRGGSGEGVRGKQSSRSYELALPYGRGRREPLMLGCRPASF
jgi:hypothetical protein